MDVLFRFGVFFIITVFTLRAAFVVRIAATRPKMPLEDIDKRRKTTLNGRQPPAFFAVLFRFAVVNDRVLLVGCFGEGRGIGCNEVYVRAGGGIG